LKNKDYVKIDAMISSAKTMQEIQRIGNLLIAKLPESQQKEDLSNTLIQHAATLGLL